MATRVGHSAPADRSVASGGDPCGDDEPRCRAVELGPLNSSRVVRFMRPRTGWVNRSSGERNQSAPYAPVLPLLRGRCDMLLASTRVCLWNAADLATVGSALSALRPAALWLRPKQTDLV